MHKNKIIEYAIEQKGRRHLEPNNDLVHIYYGPSGAGKTTSAWEEYPEAFKGCWPTGGRFWFPNYKGEKVVIFDEFRENLSYQQMLALLDIHPMGIEWKFGNSQFVSQKIIITTIRNPKHWYQKVQNKSELERRIKENCTVFEFSGEINLEEEELEDRYPRQAWTMSDFKFESVYNFNNGEETQDYELYRRNM